MGVLGDFGQVGMSSVDFVSALEDFEARGPGELSFKVRTVQELACQPGAWV